MAFFSYFMQQKCPYIDGWVVQKSLKTPLRNIKMAPYTLIQICHNLISYLTCSQGLRQNCRHPRNFCTHFWQLYHILLCCTLEFLHPQFHILNASPVSYHQLPSLPSLPPIPLQHPTLLTLQQSLPTLLSIHMHHSLHTLLTLPLALSLAPELPLQLRRLQEEEHRQQLKRLLDDPQESRERPGLNPRHNLRLKLKPLQRLRLHLITVPTMVTLIMPIMVITLIHIMVLIITHIMVMVTLTNIILRSTTITQDIIMATITMVFLIIFQQLNTAIFN